MLPLAVLGELRKVRRLAQQDAEVLSPETHDPLSRASLSSACKAKQLVACYNKDSEQRPVWSHLRICNHPDQPYVPCLRRTSSAQECVFHHFVFVCRLA